MANRNFANSRLYSGHVMPVLIDCDFIVNSSDAAGLGITGLHGPYVQNVFMHTSTTAGAGNSNPATPNMVITNPNPAAGTIIVQFQDAFAKFLTLSSSSISTIGTPVKVDNSAMTVGVAYAISTLGNTTAAQWITLGVPAGVTPAVGVVFVALLVGVAGEANTSTSRVAPSAAAGSGIFSIEAMGLPNLTLSPSISAQGFGGQIILQCRKDSASDAPVIAAPADLTLIKLQFILSNSSVSVSGG